MLEELIVAGFGGQGVLSMGMTLAYAGMVEDKEISWMPSYGPEMRGGTANCIAILSDAKISSPIISEFDSGIILNQPSMDKFESQIKMKNSKILNMIMLGAYLERKPVVKIASVMEALRKVLPDRYHNLLPINEAALNRGAELVEKEMISSGEAF